MKIKLTETTNAFLGGAQIYRPDFRELEKEKIETLLQKDLLSYSDVGYNSFMLCRATGTIHIRKIEVKTLQDIFDTDQFGLLENKETDKNN